MIVDISNKLPGDIDALDAWTILNGKGLKNSVTSFLIRILIHKFLKLHVRK